MPTIEERLQTLEQEHTTLKKTIELQTIAIGALVNKAALEKLNEKNDRLFEALINHDQFTNEQLAEVRNQQIELDGKIVGLQTEMRQRFTLVETTLEDHIQKLDDHTQRLSRVETILSDHTQRLSRVETILSDHTQRFDRVETLLTQILTRLPQNP